MKDALASINNRVMTKNFHKTTINQHITHQL